MQERGKRGFKLICTNCQPNSSQQHNIKFFIVQDCCWLWREPKSLVLLELDPNFIPLSLAWFHPPPFTFKTLLTNIGKKAWQGIGMTTTQDNDKITKELQPFCPRW